MDHRRERNGPDGPGIASSAPKRPLLIRSPRPCRNPCSVAPRGRHESVKRQGGRRASLSVTCPLPGGMPTSPAGMLDGEKRVAAPKAAMLHDGETQASSL